MYNINIKIYTNIELTMDSEWQCMRSTPVVKQGQSPEIDFHWMTKPKVRDYLKKHIFRNKTAKCAYKLITGKGNNSVNGPVLRPYIVRLLKDNNKRHENDIPQNLYHWNFRRKDDGSIYIYRTAIQVKTKTFKLTSAPRKQTYPIPKKGNAWRSPLAFGTVVTHDKVKKIGKHRFKTEQDEFYCKWDCGFKTFSHANVYAHEQTCASKVKKKLRPSGKKA